MAQVADILNQRLLVRGLTAVEISRVIEEVGNILTDRQERTSRAVNYPREVMGWHKEFVDQCSFDLILFLVQSKGQHPVPQTGHLAG